MLPMSTRKQIQISTNGLARTATTTTLSCRVGGPRRPANRRSWTLAMGKSETNLRPNFASSSSFATFFVRIFFAILVAASFAECKVCRVEECWRRYQHDLEEVTQSATAAYCSVLKEMNECVRATARNCRGNINYHTTMTVVTQWNTDYNCSHLLIASAKSPPLVTRPAPANPSNAPHRACTYQVRQPALVHCSLFGDPHLRTFNNEFQTCKVIGAWPLLDNAYVAVQVTNEAVVTAASVTATAITKVTILVKGNSHCAVQKTYEAQVDNVPSVFVDGTQTSGVEKSVRIREKEANEHVELHLRHIATTMIVRKVGRYLTVSIRMPKDVVHQGESADSLQLCSKGCPSTERIDYLKALEHPELWLPGVDGQVAIEARDRAVVKCRERNVTDFYFDSCVFDLMTTGDQTFGEAAGKAFADVKQLSPWLLEGHANRTELMPPRPLTTQSSVATSSGCEVLRKPMSSLVVVALLVGLVTVGMLVVVDNSCRLSVVR